MNRRDNIEAEHYDATHGYNERDPSRWEAEMDARRTDPKDDPMFDALQLIARDQEELARLAYGDATVDAAIARVVEEEGL